jgi:hypothetical protein
VKADVRPLVAQADGVAVNHPNLAGSDRLGKRSDTKHQRHSQQQHPPQNLIAAPRKPWPVETTFSAEAVHPGRPGKVHARKFFAGGSEKSFS